MTTKPDRPSTKRLQEIAANSFGIDEFREGQLEAMQAAGNQDVLAVMPTGHGKSAIYQVPAMALDGVAVVVSPLIALQHDQVQAINSDLGHEQAYVVNSKVGARRQRAAWEAVESGAAKFLFLTPEQLAREDIVTRLSKIPLSMFVVDEAHCISAWGHDFRPDYLSLGASVARLGHPPIVALTATASPHTRDEIVARLGMREPLVVIHSFDRPNIELRVQRHHLDADKHKDVVAEVANLPMPGLVYVATRKETEVYAAELAEHGLRAEAYHAGRKHSERDATHARFQANELDVVVATTAFGMGIDKADVRFVVHADIPNSLDSYYQEIGRAGRDGEPAVAVLHYRSEDLGLQQFFASNTPDPDQVMLIFTAVQQAGPIRAGALRDRTGLGARAQGQLLNLLMHSGSIVGGRSGFRAVKGVTAKLAVERATETAESQQLINRSRIAMARGYAETDGCRRDWLLNYFGEETDNWCGHCDWCQRAGSAEDAAQEEAETPPGWEMQTPVTHKEWGPGLVMGAEPDRITVLFESVGYKQLALELIEQQPDLLVRGQLEPAGELE